MLRECISKYYRTAFIYFDFIFIFIFSLRFIFNVISRGSHFSMVQVLVHSVPSLSESHKLLFIKGYKGLKFTVHLKINLQRNFSATKPNAEMFNSWMFCCSVKTWMYSTQYLLSTEECLSKRKAAKYVKNFQNCLVLLLQFF